MKADPKIAGAVTEMREPAFVTEGLRPLGKLIREYRFSAELDEARPALEDALDELARRGEELKTPLLILLVGGTGAGKSTLLNALAGEEIAATSAVRPCTHSLTAYLHREKRVFFETLSLEHAKIAVHDREELREKIIVDAPDFDSADSANVALLRKTLPQADLVLCLATAEKYLNRSLHELLGEFQSGKRFLFVLNRADHGMPAAVREDWSRELAAAGFTEPEILWISASHAFVAKSTTGGEGDGADFELLSRIVSEELTRRRIQAIKQLNLDEGFRDLLDQVGRILGEGWESRLSHWEQAAELEWRGFRDEVLRRFSMELDTDRRFLYRLQYRLSSRYSAVFGLFVLLGHCLRSFMSPLRPRPWKHETLEFRFDFKRQQLAFDKQGFADRVDLLLRRIAELGRARGLNKEACRLELDHGFADRCFSGLQQALDTELKRSLTDFVEPKNDRRLRWRNLACNAAPIAVIALALLRWIYADLFGDRPVGDGYFLVVSLLALTALFLARTIVEKGDFKRIHQFMSQARRIIRQAVDSALGDRLRQDLKERAAEARSGVSELRDLKKRLPGLLSTESLAIDLCHLSARRWEEKA